MIDGDVESEADVDGLDDDGYNPLEESEELKQCIGHTDWCSGGNCVPQLTGVYKEYAWRK